MKKNIFINTTFIIFAFHLFFLTQVYCQVLSELSIGEHFASINGNKIHFWVSGKGPLCLLPSPGWGPPVSLYTSGLKPLEKYFTIVYYDTRLSGESTGPEDSSKYSNLDFMNDMDSLRVYFKQKKVWLIGHSNGGYQVLNYGIHHSNELNGIIVLSPCAGYDSLREAEFTKMVLRRKNQPYFENGANILLGKDTTKRTLNELVQIIMPFFFYDTNKITLMQKYGNQKFSDMAFKNTQISNFAIESLLPDLKNIGVPTLIIVGDEDFCDKLSQADRIAKNIFFSTEIVINHAGHFTWVEQPVQFFTVCEAWLQKQGLKRN